MLNHGDTPICGIMQIDPAWGDFHHAWITYFIVANVTDETVATVKAHGGEIIRANRRFAVWPYRSVGQIQAARTLRLLSRPPGNVDRRYAQ
ncbi:MAG: hypothetical protein U0074_08590 [Kouleothrix sp.]